MSNGVEQPTEARGFENEEHFTSSTLFIPI